MSQCLTTFLCLSSKALLSYNIAFYKNYFLIMEHDRLITTKGIIYHQQALKLLYLNNSVMVRAETRITHYSHQCCYSNSWVELIKLHSSHGNKHFTGTYFNCNTRLLKCLTKMIEKTVVLSLLALCR